MSKKQIFTTAVSIISGTVFLLGGYMIFLYPQRLAIKNIEKRLTEKKTECGLVLEAQQPEIKARKKSELENLCTRIDEFTVNNKDAADLIFSVSQLANEIKIADFSSTNKPSMAQSESIIKGYDGFSEGRIVVTFLSDFSKFAAFINQLERNIPVIFVDKFTIKNEGLETSKCPVSMTISFFIGNDYYGKL